MDPNTASPKARLRGEVVYFFAYDIAYELSRELPASVMGHAVSEYRLDASKRNPKHLVFYRPRMIRLPDEQRQGPHGPVSIRIEAKILPIGAISLRVRVPFEVSHLADLVAYHDLQFQDGTLDQEIRRLAERLRAELAPWVLRANEALSEEEAYTVFCLEPPVDDGTPFRSGIWLETHRESIAGLLNQENDPACLSDQETHESTSRHISYYQHDLAVIDWDAALLVDTPSEWEECLYAIEVANLQLAELEAYDRHLDLVLERSYRDLAGGPMRTRKALLTSLRELRIDMARFSDELSNINKFLGDWHLARIYETAAIRFHLSDWKKGVEEKLKTVGELHELLKSDHSNRWMMALEITVVLLFILDVALLIAGGRK
ncbi:MAG: hypothetical protein RLZZ356_1338 [Verrucomicrobiota bacterium]|jgi:hypothetical protein